jgi:hypothetical protein
LGALGSLQHLVRQRNAEATAPRSETPFSGRKEMRTAAAEEKLSRIEVLEEVFGVQESHQRSVYKRKKGKREREREREKREREIEKVSREDESGDKKEARKKEKFSRCRQTRCSHPNLTSERRPEGETCSCLMTRIPSEGSIRRKVDENYL